MTYAALIEYKDTDQRSAFDRELEADPVAPSGPDPNVLALMMAARMPQQRPLAAAGSEWHPGERTDG